MALFHSLLKVQKIFGAMPRFKCVRRAESGMTIRKTENKNSGSFGAMPELSEEFDVKSNYLRALMYCLTNVRSVSRICETGVIISSSGSSSRPVSVKRFLIKALT